MQEEQATQARRMPWASAEPPISTEPAPASFPQARQGSSVSMSIPLLSPKNVSKFRAGKRRWLKGVVSGAAVSCCLKDKRPRRVAGASGGGLSGVGFPPCRGTQPAAPAASARRARLDCLKERRALDGRFGGFPLRGRHLHRTVST